jgi:hypothetical protein
MAAGDHDTFDILAKLKMASAKMSYDPFQAVNPYDILSSGAFVKAASSAARSLTWDDDEKVTYETDQYIKKYQISESPEDLLALSTTWYRLRKNAATIPYPIFEGLTDHKLFKLIIEEDRIMAATIRDYYRKKFVMWALTEVRLTPFRMDLSKFIYGDGMLFTDKVLPIAYRLPEFYEYDIAFTEMIRDLPRREFPVGYPALVEAHNLRPIRKFLVKRKTSKRNEYWFKDENDHAVAMSLDVTNSCLSLFEREFRQESTNMKLTGVVTTRDGFPYFKVAK